MEPDWQTGGKARHREGKDMSVDQLRPVSMWVPVAFTLTGFVIGSVTGLSLTPVIGTLLPLLFGLIGGGAGFFAITKAEHSRIVGVSLALFSLMCLFGDMMGIHLRQGTPWRCFWSICTESPTA